MKKLGISIGVVALALLAFTLAVPVLAYQYNLLGFDVGSNGKVWRISTSEVSGNSFSGKDVIEIHAYYYLDSSPTVQRELVPVRIHKLDGKITLFFDSAEITQIPYANADDKVISTSVEGTIVGGDTFLAAGPGFAWGRR